MEMTKEESQNHMNQLVLRTLLAVVVRNGGTIEATDEEMSIVNDMGMSIKLTENGIEVKAVLADELSEQIAKAQENDYKQVNRKPIEDKSKKVLDLYAKRNSNLN